MCNYCVKKFKTNENYFKKMLNVIKNVKWHTNK